MTAILTAMTETDRIQDQFPDHVQDPDPLEEEADPIQDPEASRNQEGDIIDPKVLHIQEDLIPGINIGEETEEPHPQAVPDLDQDPEVFPRIKGKNLKMEINLWRMLIEIHKNK